MYSLRGSRPQRGHHSADAVTQGNSAAMGPLFLARGVLLHVPVSGPRMLFRLVSNIDSVRIRESQAQGA